MPHPKQDSEEEDLEEGQEEVGVAAEEENEGNEGGDASIEDGRAHVNEGCLRSFSLAASHGQEGMADVHCIIHTEPDSNDDIHRTDHVYCEAPKVHVAAQVNQSSSHAEEDDDRAKEVCKEEEGGEEDAGQGDPEVPQQLPGDHLVRLPAAVFPSQRKDVPRKVAARNYGFHFGKCRIVRTFFLKVDMGECEAGEE